MPPPADWQIGRYRALLHLHARQVQRDPRLGRRFDASDVVQEALLRGHANLGQFRGSTEAELVGWLQKILANVVADAIDKNKAQKRNVDLEQSLNATIAESSARLEKLLADRQSSPSQKAERREELLRLAEAIEKLPEDQREAVILRDLQDASVAEIAAQLGRTEKSVAGLLVRGRSRLRELLAGYQ
jgi:RNA polymerase sigma-70 factor (ECF subfamily)